MRSCILPAIILLVFLTLGYKDNVPTGSGIQPPEVIPPFICGSPVWHPDGNLKGFSFGLPFSWISNDKTIVYTAYSPNDLSYQNGILWILNLLTGEKRQLIFNTKLSK